MSVFKYRRYLLNLSCLGLGLGFVGPANAASFEAVDSWTIDVGASANVLGGNQSLIKNGSGRDDDFKVHLDRPVVSMKVTSPSGAVEFFGVFNLDVLARRHTNMNSDADKYSAFDGHEARHIIENLTATVKASDNLFITGGIGTVAFMQPAGTIVSQNSLQDELFQLRERLFVEFAYVFDNGTNVQMSIFDGTKQKAVDLAGSFGLNDFVDIEKMSWDRVGDSTSVAVKVDHPLGDTGIHASLAYALVRNPLNTGGENHMVALGLDAAYELGEWLVYGLIQFVTVFGNESSNSILGEIVAEKGKLSLYGQAEYTQARVGGVKEGVTRGTLGAKYKIFENNNVTVSPFVEFYAQTSKSQDSDLGFIIGTSVELGTQINLNKKSE
jgi:hypothetical protein